MNLNYQYMINGQDNPTSCEVSTILTNNLNSWKIRSNSYSKNTVRKKLLNLD